MNDHALISAHEREVFLVDGAVVFDRPLTWEMVGALLSALGPDQTEGLD